MSDLLRMTGMYSGLDTETIVTQLVSAKQTTVTNLKGEQKKLEWKQTQWQDLNSKIYSLYSSTLSKLRLSSAYAQKTTTSSDTTKATVLASGSAVNGTQSLKINSVAKSGYLTGAKLESTKTELAKDSDGKLVYESVGWTASDSLVDLGRSGLSGSTIKVTVGEGTAQKTTEIKITSDMKISDFVSKLKEAGVNASFDETNQRFFISAKDSGVAGDFFLSDDTGNGAALTALGLNDNNYLAGTSMVRDENDPTKKFIGVEKISDIDSNLVGKTLEVTANGETKEITITEDMTLNGLSAEFEKAGLNGSFNISSQSFSFSSNDAASDKSFSIKVQGESDNSSLAKLGLADAVYTKGSECTKLAGQDAEIELNGAVFTSTSNAFSINGLTINVTGVTAEDEEVSLVTSTDYDGIYDTIKDFITEYNELINEMDKLYNADSAREYAMLTDDEKAAMTDDEIETWENTIKASLLRKDSTLGTVMNSLINLMIGGVEVEVNGKKQTKYLSDYGIKTLSYFVAQDNEHHAYHIDGDPDDENTATNEDKLKAAIAADPEGTAEFFAALCKSMYEKLDKLMETSEYSSVYKVYNDKQLKTEYDDYTTKIKEAEEALSDYEDKWYDKFSAMEVALSKLQSNTNAISGLLGTS